MAKAKQTETDTAVDDRPVLDLNDTKVKKFMKAARDKGFVTVEELNSILPQDELSSDQIEDTMAMLSEQGISVVESEEEVRPAPKGQPSPRLARKRSPKRAMRAIQTVPTIRFGCICAKWARLSCCPVKAKSQSRNELKLAETR